MSVVGQLIEQDKCSLILTSTLNPPPKKKQTKQNKSTIKMEYFQEFLAMIRYVNFSSGEIIKLIF